MQVLDHVDAAEIRALTRRASSSGSTSTRPTDRGARRARRAPRPAPAGGRGHPGVRPAPEDRRLRRPPADRLLRRPATRRAATTPSRSTSTSSGGCIVTVHRGRCTPLDGAARARRRATPTDEIVYRILDALTDSFFPCCATLEAAVDALERRASRARPERAPTTHRDRLRGTPVPAAAGDRRRSATSSTPRREAIGARCAGLEAEAHATTFARRLRPPRAGRVDLHRLLPRPAHRGAQRLPVNATSNRSTRSRRG